MNLKQLTYIVTIADEQSISRAAELLFISRPALNHYLINLESELGAPLFNRIRKKLIPTTTGSVYIDAARNILEIKKQAYKQLEDISDCTIGCLSLGITRGFGVTMMKKIFPLFHQIYPNYKVDLVEGNVRELESAVLNGRIDLAVVGCGSAQTSLQHIPFKQCEVILVLPSSHPLSYMAAPRDKPYNTMNLRLLENDSFVLMNSETNIRTICNHHFTKAGFSPQILMECSLSSMAYSMVKQGVAPSILMEHQIDEDDGVCCFSLDPKEIWNHSIAFRKGMVFTKAEKYFIDLAKEYFAKSDLLSLQ
ncbi:MAG: LysR family transcriptional regulator [Clostridia bacterium]